MSSEENKKTLETENRKEFALSTFAIDNSTSIMVLVVLIAIMGVVSYIMIPKEAEPDITIPNIIVITTYPGVSPEDMESLVTQKLEDELTNISDIKELRSTTQEGYSSIIAEFNTGINMDEALQKVREKVDLAKPEIPTAANDPIIQEINISELPIVQVNISGEYSLERLKKVAEDLQDRIESIPQVLEVDLAGGLEREVKIDVDVKKLKYYDVSFKQVIEAIQFENVTIPGGTLDVGSKKYLVRVPGEYKNPDLMANIVVASPGGNPIYLRDIADVDFGYKEKETNARLDGLPVISLAVKKRTGQNLIETVDRVREIIRQESASFPPTTVVKLTADKSKQVVSMVSNLENNIISGLILVITVLLFFMGVRNASFVGISIPMSMFLSFIVLSFVGITMNMIVLFSLILALGMLVDNAIVVVENIYRYLEEGYDNFTAAKKGTGEVAIPIISGTLTTLGAFLPMVFWDGIIGEFMGYLPKTLIITLSSSLFIGLVINPVLCALFMKLDTETSSVKMTKGGRLFVAIVAATLALVFLFISPISTSMILGLSAIIYLLYVLVFDRVAKWWQKKGMPGLVDLYGGSLRWSLHHRLVTLLLAMLAFVGSFVLFYLFNAGSAFFPETIPPKEIYAHVETPVGTKLEFTDQLASVLEERIDSLPQHPDIESVVANVGSKISGNMDGGGQSTNLATVVVSLKDFQVRQFDAFELLETMRQRLPSGLAGADITIEKPQNGPPTGKPINLELKGRQVRELQKLAANALRTLENSPVYAKLEGLDDNLPDSRPELSINVDRERASLYGLTTSKIGTTVQRAINGVEASNYRDGEDEFDITVRLSKANRSSLDVMEDLTIVNDVDQQIPLSEVATWEIVEGLGGIKRIDGERTITVSADVRSGYNANAVLGDVQETLNDFVLTLPKGYSATWTGQQEEQQESQDFLVLAFLIALFLISFVLVAQFNSLFKPLMVMTSVIMSTAGVLIGLIIFQMPFIIIMTGIGIISLAGVVVNNAIVLIDYIDLLRERDGMNLTEALFEAGKTRFRPVILTASTTILGLVPLAIGFNFDFITFVANPIEFFTHINEYIYYGGEQKEWWAPMAIAVIVGLGFATALTLIVVPVLYSSFDSVSRFSSRFFYGKDEGIPADPVAEENTNELTDSSLKNGHTNGYPKSEEKREQEESLPTP